MDNLTHSLVGVLLGQMGLKRKTGLAMPTLIIAVNIPDIDAVAVLLGGHQHLAIRRGITHGPVAMLVLPLLLWAAMLWFDRWQMRRGTRPEKRSRVHKGWLLALAFIGCLSHPLFDWFNSYGVRLLEPFSSGWFYGDTLFIIDVWIWVALTFGVWLSARLERRTQSDGTRPARTAGIVISVYVFANFAISTVAANSTDNFLRARGVVGSRTVIANPVPLAFWQREMLWRTPLIYGSGHYSLFGGLKLEDRARRHNAESWTLDASDNELRDFNAFLVWTRMPIFETRGDRIIVTDQRFNDGFTRDRFKVEVGAANQ